MLTLTENASAIVNQIIAQGELGESGGLRISAEGSDQPELVVTAAHEGEPGDQVVEHGGASVYLDEPAAATLDDKILDAAVDENGQVGFSIAQQA